MATVEPFQGIRYNPQKITSPAAVVTPPYDVISDRQQADYHARSPFNVIRIELGRSRPEDDAQENAHTRAHRYLQEWQSQEVLIQDPEPSFYLVSSCFAAGKEPATRWGLIAQVGLEPFSPEGHILPHEKTFPQIKSERLGLMRACGLNTSPIFALFDDQGNLMPRLQAHVATLEPELDFEDESHTRHCLWRLADPDDRMGIQVALEDRRLYIADGHHRYETCLAYRDECARNDKHFNRKHPANGTLMYLSSMQDPGLQVLPTHRALPAVAPRLREGFIERARPYFDCRTMETGSSLSDADALQLYRRLEAIPAEEGLGVVIHGDERLHLLRLKPDAAAHVYASDVPPPLQQLNVTLLSEFVFPKLLDISAEKLEDAHSLHFRHNTAGIVSEVRRGDYDMAFILRATPVEKVRMIAEAGLSMPRKTTYFAPKVVTGLVMRTLKPAI